jgi:hypothetical protein
VPPCLATTEPARQLEIGRHRPAAGNGSSGATALDQPGPCLGLVRVRLEKQEDRHAGDRNVEPNGKRPACDSAVHREPAGQ